MYAGTMTNLYVEVFLINHDKSTVASQRTRAANNTTFNETFEFKVKESELDSTELKIKVMDNTPSNQDQMIGFAQQPSLSDLQFDRCDFTDKKPVFLQAA